MYSQLVAAGAAAGKFRCLLTVQQENQTNQFFSCDSLTIYDGGSSTSPMMGKYCSDSIPPSHVSSSNEILTHFQSDGGETHRGFQMEYNPTGKQNTSSQNNTEFYGNRYRVLRHSLFIGRFIFVCRKVIKITNSTLFNTFY